MFNHRTASISAYIILASLIILNLFVDIGYVPYLVLFLVCGGIIFYGSAFVNSGFYFKMVCSAKTDEKIIAITFDDGPTQVTPLILDVLKEYNVHAAFFTVGSRIENNEHILKRINEEGHLIGNHSYFHNFWFSNYSAKRIHNELQETDAAIEKCTGRKVNLFRPPSGVTNPNIKKVVIKINYIPVGWSVKSKDTVIESSDKISARIRSKVKPGDIILLHDTNVKIVQPLRELLEYAVQSGYKVVRLDELLNVEPYK
ncbi:MAG: polysaccharide deacetylase family protein [Bacteroidota bacterium]